MNAATRQDQAKDRLIDAPAVKVAIEAVEKARADREAAHRDWVEAAEGGAAARTLAEKFDWFRGAAKSRWDEAAAAHGRAKETLSVRIAEAERDSFKTPEQIRSENAYRDWEQARDDFHAKTEELGRARAVARVANQAALKRETEDQNFSDAT